MAINDNFNLGMDRVKLATLPTLIGRKYALQDNETIYFEPEHVMEVDDPTTDLKELQISDDIKGTIDMNYLLASKMQQVSSEYPTTMGDLPAASNTATAVAGAESRANLRSNYKSLTFENTFLLDLYTLILNMTYQYATPETMKRLMGDDAQFFDPDQDYAFLPVATMPDPVAGPEDERSQLRIDRQRLVGSRYLTWLREGPDRTAPSSACR